jgi:hypothetical protein
MFSSALVATLGSSHYSADQRARIAYGVRKVDSETLVSTSLVDEIDRTTKSLPSAAERIDNLVVHMATAGEPGCTVDLTPKVLRASLGCTDAPAVSWVLQQAGHKGFLSQPAATSKNSLSAAGWDRFEDLMKSGKDSKHAFMAMSFGHPDIAGFYRDHLQDAVAKTGFALRKTNDDHASAGAIDVRMKVEIRTARFVLCDLSHGNRGAYWEAGFAEGVGRPVIYLCRRDVLRDKTHEHHPHFDTANQLIIAWDSANPAEGLEELKAVIRATLPAEATMQD